MTHTAEPSASGLDAVLRSLWRRKAIVLAVAVLIPLAVGLATLALDARYHAAAEVMLNPAPRGDAEQEATGPAATRAAIASQVEVLTARDLLRRVVTREQLVADSAFGPGGEDEATLLDRLGLTGSDARELTRAQQRRRAVAALKERLTVRREGRSRVARVGVTAGSPELAARLANAVAETYIDRRRELRERRRDRTSGRLGETVERLRTKVREAEDSVAQYRQKNDLTGETGAGTPGRELAALTSDLAEARADLAEAEARVTRAEELARADDAGASASALDSPLIQKLRVRLTELRAEKAELDQRYGPKHPEMKTVQAQIDRLRARIEEQVARVVAGLRNDAEVARERVTSLEAAVARKREQVSARRADAAKLARLERAAETERELFTSFLTRLREADNAGNSRAAGARLLARAQPPLSPSAPNRPLIVALALLTALPCAAGLALFVDHRDSGLKNLAELEQATGAPAVAQLPKVGRVRGRSPARHALDRPASAFAEGVQGLQTDLDGAGAPRRFLVTSAQPREGKSSLALAYGRLLARRGESAVLVEADLRRPGLAESVRAPEHPGLGEVLTAAAPLDAALHSDPDTGLTVLPAGERVGEPGDVLAGPRVGAVLAELGARFRHVIVDVPPLIPVADARRLAPHVDAVVLAVRWRATRHATLDRAVRQLAHIDAPVRGAALNRVNRRQQKHYGAGEEVAYGRDSRAYYSG